MESGQRLGIFGASRTGKTTLASILSLIEPTPAGTLFFNGQDVTESNVKPLRDCISVVPQRRFLFSTSIANNIAFSDPSMAAQTAESRCKRACVITDILAFPNQWDTLVGEKRSHIIERATTSIGHGQGLCCQTQYPNIRRRAIIG